MHTDLDKPLGGWRRRFYTVIFESDTVAGRRFDQVLIGLILISVGAVILDSMESVRARFGPELDMFEWLFTAAFTVEYLLRLACTNRPLKYALSFYGLIDLLSVLPSYLALIDPNALYFLDVRILRLMRIFRVFKLTGYVSEYTTLGLALLASRRKILVFTSFVLMVALLMATAMYVIEGPQNGFTSIPTAMYWAITTMTTVGFGDITPKTDLGRLISALVMLLGWSVLAVPTGIVTAELTARQSRKEGPASGQTTHARRCVHCLTEGHLDAARHCWHCGAPLPSDSV
ncbi:ion transporter [Aquabacterium sp.]|uniref:ion transporter n=1 Tax=Aquabacterium sp. TaxID=1872578 RepID=UPI002E31593D|nr:ion transporter [Aquabacterium sp.]HEX5311285.1 ion transporter [Aquabacterium sp.]